MNINKGKKKFLTMLVTLSMMLSLIPSSLFPSQAASAASSSTSVLHYNQGHRDTVATSLSDAAVAYYSDFAYDYADIADGTVTPDTDALKSALASLMQSTLELEVSYSSLPTYWAYTDAEDGTAGTVYFYSDVDSSSYSATLNREHVWPKSHASFYEKNGGADLHHLRPAIDTVNSYRSAYTMGEIDETSSSASSKVIDGKAAGYILDGIFEPAENVKGDVARIFLYVYLTWGQPNLFEDVSSSLLPEFDSDDSANDGQKVIESLETLLTWCYLDPVDTWEMEQNDLVELVQGNRNVFIDYPEYAWLIFGLEPPEDLVSPTSGNTVVNTDYDPGDLSGISGITTTEVEIDEADLISLSDANSVSDGVTVTVKGQVAYTFGTNDTATSAVIIDENGDALQLYYGTSSFDYEIGDIILVKGAVATYHGVKQVGSGFASKLVSEASENDAVTPVTVTLAELNSDIDSFVSKLVLV